jgi:voltage-gated sodium channel
MAEKLNKIVESKYFNYFIIIVILCAGLIVGLETYPAIMENYGTILHILDKAVLYIFVVEILIKIGAKGNKPWKFFNDGWNVFDFIIVAVCFLPFAGAYIAVLRLARILRVFRLVTALPKLQILVGALIKSIPSMSYVGLLLILLFYIYSVLGVFLFGKNDPVHFGSLQISMLTLFKVITLEGWIDIMDIQIFGSDVLNDETFKNVQTEPSQSPVAAPIYFISFIFFGTMIVLNLFIGVIINGMDETRKEAEKLEMDKQRLKLDKLSFKEEIGIIEKELEEVNNHLKLLKNRVE